MQQDLQAAEGLQALLSADLCACSCMQELALGVQEHGGMQHQSFTVQQEHDALQHQSSTCNKSFYSLQHQRFHHALGALMGCSIRD
eukprot:jgi/Chrzof1/5149/Cz15g13110.t1